MFKIKICFSIILLSIFCCDLTFAEDVALKIYNNAKKEYELGNCSFAIEEFNKYKKIDQQYLKQHTDIGQAIDRAIRYCNAILITRIRGQAAGRDSVYNEPAAKKEQLMRPTLP